MRVLTAVLREIPENLRGIFWMNVLSALSTTSLVWLVAAATNDASSGKINARTLILFAITVAVFSMTHIYTLTTASQDAERLIHKLRTRLFDLVRHTDLVTVERIGHASLQKVLTQDTQTLAQTLPLLAIGFQQALMLVFLAVYLAWLSPLACVLVFSMAGAAVAVRFARVKALRSSMQQAGVAEADVFGGLTDLLHGFKEVRMSRLRADGVVKTLAEASFTAEKTNTSMKSQWGRNYAVIEAMFYSLIGLMVFVVPLFTTNFYEVVVPAMTAALFIAGPVGTISFVTPMLTHADMALANIEAMEAQLRTAAVAVEDEFSSPLPGRPTSIVLSEARLTYTNDDGEPLFTAGPINAEFKAGEITFITGGNGSGKSTLLRLLTGLIPLDQGELQVNGAAVSKSQMQDYRDQISAVFSDYHLSRRLYGVELPDPVKVQALLERLDLLDKVSIEHGQFSTIDLSTGQRKRLALLIAELEDRPVIVLDEWAADQDPHFRRVFYEELLPELKAKGKMVICVTHDDRWFQLADRIYRMNEGRISS